MKLSLRELRRRQVQRLVIESVDLSLYIAHAEIDGQSHLLTDHRGGVLKTPNLLRMKELLAGIACEERVLRQRSAYDEMVGSGVPAGNNTLEVRLGPGYETLPRWQH